MISCSVPGRGIIEISHLVCDVNGTLTRDGILIPGVKDALEKLSKQLQIHAVSANSLGRLSDLEVELENVLTSIEHIAPNGEAEQKVEFVQKLGSSSVAAIGQGTNDRLMLKSAALGICVVSPEGTAVETMLNADILVPDILSAFELFLIPDRLKATLRQ